VMLGSFFSEQTINKVIYTYYTYYKGYDYLDTMSTEEITAEIADYELIDFIHLTLWVSFYLVEMKRMIFASSDAYKDPYGYSDKSFMSSDKTINTQVGTAFTVTENQKSDGKDAEGFTSLWGDSESYMSKHQIYIRTRFEKMFKDFSLRDNTGISTNIPMYKSWDKATWNGGGSLEDAVVEILSKSNSFILRV